MKAIWKEDVLMKTFGRFYLHLLQVLNLDLPSFVLILVFHFDPLVEN